MEVLKVVKRYGLCGGMEEYAYRLSGEIFARGIPVTILCERVVTPPIHSGIKVVEVSESLKKPRWLSHILFSRKICDWKRINPSESRIIHSHERIDCHHLTTIHSTLFNFPRKGLPGFRKYMNEYLERRELLAPSLRQIVPVSRIIEEQIKSKYPKASSFVSPPISPGVLEIKSSPKPFDPESPVVGFMGKEWRRKGLPKVIQIWRKLRKDLPQAKLCLAGFPSGESLGLSTEEREHARILGWIERKKEFFGQIDLLLHPARIEAYGMVVAEAMALRIPVICSIQCGASNDVTNDHGKVLDYNAADSEWADCVSSILLAKRPEKPFQRSWETVSLEYQNIYQELESAKV
ncbi:MAG: glycosyltransferase family 4 protein [Verrucomicrobia bacterium]|nr:glycosyltransferase family 4 protein [Verrucomicrobiota bacterium]